MLAFFLVLLAILMIGIGYTISIRTVGPEIAQRDLRLITWLIPLSFVVSLGLHSLYKYGWLSPSSLFIVLLALWILTWNWRKKRAGVLLLDVGQIPIGRVIFWFCVLEVLIAAFKTWSAMYQISTGLLSLSNTSTIISQVLLYWLLAFYTAATGSSRLELREHGICYIFLVIQWNRLVAYRWDDMKPNILIIQVRPPSFLPFKQFWNLPIPAVYRNTVAQIMAEHVTMSINNNGKRASAKIRL